MDDLLNIERVARRVLVRYPEAHVFEEKYGITFVAELGSAWVAVSRYLPVGSGDMEFFGDVLAEGLSG